MLVLKDVLRPRLKPGSSGGGRFPARQVPYRQNQVYIQVIRFSVRLSFQPSNSATRYSFLADIIAGSRD